MKRQIFILLTLCLCALLAACHADDSDNLFETTQGQTESTTDSTDSNTEAASTVPQAQGTITIEEGYQHGNMQKNVPSGNFMRNGNDVVILAYMDNRYGLYTYDMETGEVSTFSKDATKPGVLLSGNLESHKGKLYALNLGSQIVEVKDDGTDAVAGGGVGQFWHYNDHLYVKTKDSSLMVYEDASRAPRMLLEEYTGMWSVIFGRYLYANGYANDEDGIIRVDLEADAPQEEVLVKNAIGIVEGHHIYYVDYKNWYLYRCNMDGSDPVLLLDKPVLPASWNFDDEYFYFRLYTDLQLEEEDCYDLYRFPKEDPTQIEKIAALPMPVYQVFTVPGYDKIFVKALAPWQEDGNREEKDYIYVMGTDGSDPQLLELPDY